MWSRIENKLILQNKEKIMLEYLNLKSCFSRRKSLNYKNRSLAHNFNVIERSANFFNFKGHKLRYLKALSFANLFFFSNFAGIKNPKHLYSRYRHTHFQVNLESYPLLHKLLSESDYYMDFNVLIPTFLNKDLPMLKASITERKFTKKKKIKNRLRNKYNVRYVYVPHKQRILVSLRWFGMLTKLSNKSLVNSFIDNTLNIADETNSYIIQLRNQIYLGLAAEHD